MTRPTDWSILELGSDPVPGDWSEVNHAATRYAAIADAIAQAKHDLLRVFDEEQLSSEAIHAVRDTALKVADRIGHAKERYHGVAEALAGYVKPLQNAQDHSVAILNNALAASGDRAYALREFHDWERKYEDAVASGDPTAISHTQHVRDSWQQKYSESNDHIAMAIASLNTIIENRDSAANQAAALIENVENSGGLNDDFWDKVDEFYDNNPWINDAIKIAGYVAAALAVIAMFVPGLNVLVLVVSIVVAAAVIANAWAKAGTGRESIGQAIFETVTAVIPFGVGKVFSVVGKAATSSVVDSAASSIMHSAAGSGMSGLTKPIATSVIENFIKSGPAIALKSDFGALLNLSALAKTPILQSGGVAEGLASSVSHAGTIFGIQLVHTAVDPLIGLGIEKLNLFGGQPVNSWQNANW